MKKIINISILLLFCTILFSSYIIVKNKVKKNEYTFILEKDINLTNKERKTLISSYGYKEYFWRIKLLKTYHSNGMSINFSIDTLSKVLFEKK